MKTKKGTVFWITFFTLIILYLFTLFVIRENAAPILNTIIMGLVFAGFGFQVYNVADNAFKGKFYREQLDK